MKVFKYIPLLLLASCTSTKVMDQSKHYNNYQSYSVSHNDAPAHSPASTPKRTTRQNDEILFSQSTDEDYVRDSRPVVPKRDNRTYHVQNYYENSAPISQHPYEYPSEYRMNSGVVQYLPPNLFFRPSEFNPFKY